MKSDYIKPKYYNIAYKYLQYENALCLRLCLETGLRVGDALKVRCEDIKGRTLTYTAEKTGKKGKKVISQKLKNELLRNGGGKGYVFKGRGKSGHRCRQTVWKDLKNGCEKAGIQGHFTPHSSRKTYAVELYHKKGIDETQQELQHERLSTTMTYAFSDILSGSNGQEGINGTELEELVYRACKRALTDFFENSEFTFLGK